LQTRCFRLRLVEIGDLTVAGLVAGLVGALVGAVVTLVAVGRTIRHAQEQAALDRATEALVAAHEVLYSEMLDSKESDQPPSIDRVKRRDAAVVSAVALARRAGEREVADKLAARHEYIARLDPAQDYERALDGWSRYGGGLNDATELVRNWLATGEPGF
jgi:hypothetical protein